MKKITHSIGLSSGLVFGAVLVLGMLVSAPSASADMNILVDRNLTVGSTGQAVVVLQGLLSEMGHLKTPNGLPTGYFGPLTREALAEYQASRGVAPAVGYFGPLTKVSMHQQFQSRNWLGMMGW